MYRKIFIVCGMPRSGTSWLGQIFDSSPDVAFRMEPLFSYRFKNIIDEKSSKKELERFFKEVYETDDEFIHQSENRNKGSYDTFKKNPSPTLLVIKTTRHHNLIPHYLNNLDNLNLISIVRHPCAAISSWINTDNEFSAKGCRIDKDWKSGKCRKDGQGEYWGFDDWLEVTKQHLALSKSSSNVHIMKYSNLIRNPEQATQDLFRPLDIAYTQQTIDFLKSSTSNHNDDPYAVFKSYEVETQWKSKLDPQLATQIIDSTIRSGLEEFLY